MTTISPHSTRHPELVSGSTAQRLRQAPCHGEVSPVGVARFNKVNLPGVVPALELLFTGDSAFHGFEELGMDESVDTIPGCKAARFAGPVLPYAGCQIGRDTNIQGPALLAGENVGAGVPALHGASIATPWMLKQVQHDGVGQFRK